MSKKVACSVCGIPAPMNPRRAGWLVRGHRNLVCPDCLADLKAKARGGSHGAFRVQDNISLQFNDSISASSCQENSPDFIAFVESQFAGGARRVRLV